MIRWRRQEKKEKTIDSNIGTKKKMHVKERREGENRGKKKKTEKEIKMKYGRQK